jgi:histidine triad (HIT) family protein
VSETNCIFCKIARGDIPSTVVHEEEDFLAFRDVNPQAPTHVLVIPRRHVASVNELTDEDEGLAGRLLLAARRVAAAEELAEDGYRLVVNTGGDGGQTVHHLHLHVLGGRAMGWPPG